MHKIEDLYIVTVQSVAWYIAFVACIAAIKAVKNKSLIKRIKKFNKNKNGKI
jgi:hypothetical protein